MRVDVHQHLWTDRLVAALARRAEAPRLRPGRGGWRLELAGEPPFLLEPRDPSARAAELAAADVDRALVALSAALGVEMLPPDAARAVIEAWDADAAALPDAFGAWGAVPLAQPDPADVDTALDAGHVGICLPATELASPLALDRLGPLLARLEVRDAPLFVHPGPAPAGTWLPPLTAYVAALNAAWHAWALHGRAAHPRLRVVFAALAGLAPLQAERLAARGHAGAALAALADPDTYYDTSSYGPRAVEAMRGAVGPHALVHGSDWPYAEGAPPLGDHAGAVLRDNPAALLHGEGAPA